MGGIEIKDKTSKSSVILLGVTLIILWEISGVLNLLPDFVNLQ